MSKNFDIATKSFLPRKNRIINGGFKVWQRGEEFAGNTGYSADRMFVDNQGQGLVCKGKIFSDSILTIDNIDPFGDNSGIALWKFDGDATDVGGNYNGTWSGTEQYDTGVFGQAAKFDGNSYIDIENPSTLIDLFTSNDKQWTVSVWFNYFSFNESWSRILDFGGHFVITHGGTSSSLAIYHRYNSDYSGLSLTNTTTINTNTIYHLVVINDNGNYKVFLNLNDITSISSLSSSFPNYINNAFMGKSVWNGDGLLKGLIDQVRIFNRALNNDEVKQLFLEESKIFYKPAFTYKIIQVPDFTSNYIKPLEYRFEGQHLADLVDAKEKVTVSFTMNSKKTGTYSIALQNKTDSDNIETILQEFTYNGNEDERIEVTFDLSQFTTPVNYDENLGLVLVIGAYTENSDLVGSVGLNTGEKLCTSNSVAYEANVFVTIENLQLEKGSYATEFEETYIQIDELLCKRYFRFSNNTTFDLETISMRTNPTVIGSAAPYQLDAEL